MKFVIKATSCWLDVGKLIKEYPSLYKFGFVIEDVKFPIRTFLRDENGEQIFQIEERKQRVGYVFLDSLEQLTDLIKAVDNEVLVSRCESSRFDAEYEIEIHDGYME